MSNIFTETPVNGRYIFKDTFSKDLSLWEAISGAPSIIGGLLSLPAGAEVRSKQQFACATLVIVAKSNSAPSLQLGFDGGDVDYVVVSNGNVRCKSTVDQTEGTTAVSFTETNYNIFAIMWNLDALVVWVNGGTPVIYQGIKIPQKGLPVSLKNIGSGIVSVQAVTVYPEPVAIEPFQEGSASGLGPLAMPIYYTGGLTYSAQITALVLERLLALPYTDTTTPLGAGATFPGTSRDLQGASSTPYYHYAGIRTLVYADQAGTLYVDESPDGSTWTQGVSSVAVASGTVGRISHKATCRYVRLRYVNGSTAQGTFKLYSRVVGSDP